MLKEFCDWLIKYGAAAGTVETYERNVRLALGHHNGPLGRLRDTGLAPKTRRATLAALRAWGAFHEDDAFLRDLKKIKLPPAVRKAPRFPFTETERNRLLEAIDTCAEAKPIVAVLGILTLRGFRVGGVLRMTREEVARGLRTGVLPASTGGKFRPEAAVAPFKKYLQMLMSYAKWQVVEDLVSPTSNKTRRRKTATILVGRALKRIAASVGIVDDVYPHRLRRTVATLFLERAGGDLVKLTKWMGWQDIKTAYAYTDDVDREELDEIWGE